MEVRTLLEEVEFREEGPTGRMAVGYAFRYNKLSRNLGGFVERVVPGAATKTIQEQDIRALFNHKEDNVLGRLKAGTLRLQDTKEGLKYFIDLPNTTLGNDVAELLRRGDITGSSFGFMPVGKQGETVVRSEQGYPIRELRLIRIRDVGPVTFPAYESSDARLVEPFLRNLAETRSIPFDELSQAASEDRLAEILFRNDDTTRPGETHRVIRHIPL